jgi:hypothetical protein
MIYRFIKRTSLSHEITQNSKNEAMKLLHVLSAFERIYIQVYLFNRYNSRLKKYMSMIYSPTIQNLIYK